MSRTNHIHKVIAVYGNSGCYKTLTAVAIAKAISKKDADADIAVIGLDSTKPLIPILFPKTDSKVSVGKVLSSENLAQETITENILTSGKIGVMGYNSGENHNSYASPIDSRIDDFITQMRHLVNYTIIDCNSDITADNPSQ